MQISYLNNTSWSAITREERFFCAHLYTRIQHKGIVDFLNFLSPTFFPKHESEPLSESWDLGYEVCFYRDFCRLTKQSLKPYSSKRTFDLVFFSQDIIILCEAKSYEDHNIAQLENLKNDQEYVAELTKADKVLTASIISSKYSIPNTISSIFDIKTNWAAIASYFENDAIFLRADDIYEEKARNFVMNNSGGYMLGDAIVANFQSDTSFWIGRKGGLAGVQKDVTDGSWKKRLYQTSTSTDKPNKQNWLSLEEFIQTIVHNKLFLY